MRADGGSALGNYAGPGPGAGPVQLLPPRQLARPWIAVAALAAVAWAVTATLGRHMGNGSARMGLFLGGYVLAWAGFGAVAFAALAEIGRLVTASPAAKGLGVAIVSAAGLYQLTIWKDRFLRRCRSPVVALLYDAGTRGRSRDVRAGLHHGAACVGCCWGLMIVLAAAGVMNLAVMAVLTVVTFTEKLWRYGRPFGQAVGLVLVAAGVLALWFPWLLPGLHASAMPVM